MRNCSTMPLLLMPPMFIDLSASSYWCLLLSCMFFLPSRILPSIPKMTWNMCVEIQYFAQRNSTFFFLFHLVIVFHHKFIQFFRSFLSLIRSLASSWADWDYWRGIWRLKADLLCSLMITKREMREKISFCYPTTRFSIFKSRRSDATNVLAFNLQWRTWHGRWRWC